MMRKESVLRQVSLSHEIRQQINNSALDAKITVAEQYNKAFRYFIKYRKSTNCSPHYLVSPNVPMSKNVSIWVEAPVLSQLEEIAKDDCVPVNRVIYTAIVFRLAQKKYLHVCP